jgi:hypothetical protein
MEDLLAPQFSQLNLELLARLIIVNANGLYEERYELDCCKDRKLYLIMYYVM